MAGVVGPEQSSPPEQQRSESEQASAERDAHRLRNGIIWTAVLLLLLLAVGLAVPDLRSVLARAAHASRPWLIFALALEVASCLGYVAVVRLVLHRGPPRPMRWLAWAELAFGAVVPAGGAGGLAVGVWAMRAWGLPWSRIANRSAVIFLLTSAVNVIVLAVAGFGVTFGIGTTKGFLYGLIPAVVATGALVFFLILPRFIDRVPPRGRTRRIHDALRPTAGWIADTEQALITPHWRLLGAFGFLLFDIAVLWACLRAVGASPPILGLVVAYQVGYLSNLVPIPGGVGVLDGGLLAALVLYGVPAAPAAAAVALYHTIALWIPVMGGTYGFARLRRTVTDPAAVQATRRAAGLPGEAERATPAPATRTAA